jgi:UDP-N-acetylglucosamine--N-acetylmuramyl-(pentapeptide) pyrophosphoryl-undecaprenol N-acetylglucosamine transferase
VAEHGQGKLVMLAAGGTGGHLFPAQALAEELVGRGYKIQLMTDERVRDYGKSFPAEAVHIVPSATLGFSEPMKIPGRLLRLFKGYQLSKQLISKHGAVAVAGFGGYPSLPPLVAATHLGVPSLVHEQNSVLGRANRILAKRVSAVATSFDSVRNVPDGANVTLTGNPVRSVVNIVAGAAYPTLSDSGDIRMLVFGGSQGARFFADMMPGVAAALPEALRKRLIVTQQCREEDMQRTTEAYQASGIRAELNPFFMDMPQRMAASHIVVCRSGASSIAELGVVGRPAVLVPLPHALDNDQLRNAETFEAAGAGWLKPQSGIETNGFAVFLAGLLSKPEGLKEAAGAALRLGKPDAARRLADLLQSIIAR